MINVNAFFKKLYAVGSTLIRADSLLKYAEIIVRNSLFNKNATATMMMILKTGS